MLTLKQARGRVGFTQQEVAAIIGVSNLTVHNDEKSNRATTLSRIRKYTKLYQISFDDIVFGDSEQIEKFESEAKKRGVEALNEEDYAG